MSRNRQKPRFNRTRFQRLLLKWHARLGGIAALFILLVTITGLLLNHQELTGIHNSDVTAEWVLDWYYGSVPAGEDVNAFRPPSIPLSRLLLDVHTGRFFNVGGAVVMDLAAVALLLLVGSGIYNWVKRKRW